MLRTTRKLPIIALAGTISFLANIATFAVMTSPAKAQEAPLPIAEPIPVDFPPYIGFTDPYAKTPILGYTPGVSLIRLANLRDEGIVTNTITIYGLDEKNVLGTVQVDVPAKASVSVEPHLMLETFAPVNWRQPIVLYVENGRDKQLWQHVKYDWRSGQLEDASVCTNAPHADYIPVRHVALNVYKSFAEPFNSRITVHNFSDVEGTFTAYVYDAGSGGHAGQLDITVPPHGSLTQTGRWYWNNSAEVRVAAELPGTINIEFVPKAPDSGARLAVQHVVVERMTGTTANLSNPCPIHGGTITIPPLPNPQ
ncbi:MAG: hypothetical protein AB7E79_09445 [Rhodospirillaceae bacterium]